MLSAKTVKIWYGIHKWTSLICTVFLLMLCITGLPIIFYHELQHLIGYEVETAPMPEGTSKANVDRVVDAGMALNPDKVMRYVYWDEDEPDLVFLTLVPSIDAPPGAFHIVAVDARTAEVLAEPKLDEGFLYFMYKLHVDMFAGPNGMLFLGFMGCLFVASLVSGTLLYAPFMRKLVFGVVRKDKTPRLKWLDLHNLLGIVTLTWALVVGGTGVINTLGDVMLKMWQYGQLTEMIAPYKGKPMPENLSSLEEAVRVAREREPGMRATFVAYPGSPYSSKHHYAIFMNGQTAVTSHLFKPVLIDAETSEFTDSREMPWYIKTLFMSQPLHFGDYGGMPMKIIWAILDVITIIVLGSGLYLWLTRRKKPIEERIEEIERGGAESGKLAAEGVTK